MRRCSVNSSDLAQARELSALLAAKAARPPAPAPIPPPEVQPALPLPAVAQPPLPPHAEPTEVALDLHALPLDLESWEVFLAWSLELSRARAAFVVDPQGFVVATRGNVPSDHFEGLGAEMAYAMEQLNRIDGEAGPLLTIELQFASRRLVAVRADRGEEGSFVIGFVGARPLSDEVRGAILRQLAHSLERLS